MVAGLHDERVQAMGTGFQGLERAETVIDTDERESQKTVPSSQQNTYKLLS